MRILILGGYGTFGGRLAYLLARDERLVLLIAGRSQQKAGAFCEQLPPGAQRIPLVFDRDGDAEAQLRSINPDLVVDASGPFQTYGEDPYRVVRACIANTVDYMDLADASGFVSNISQFDEPARSKNIFILSGVSSFPVLSAAVVRRLSQGFVQINTIKAGLAPSPYAGVGLNVIRALASYAGKPLQLFRNRQPSYAYALTETMRYTIAPPGHLPMRHNLFSLVDVPDLRVLPELWPELDSVWMGAGPVPEILHRMLIGLAWLVRMRILPSLLPLARLFHLVINLLRRGEHRGGMFVLVDGCDEDGEKVQRSWHLVAEGDDGPLIPSMAATALVQRSLSGVRPASGARPATRDLELEDYEALFRNRRIYTGQRERTSRTGQLPLYQRLLASAWHSLPGPLIALHESERAWGEATVQAGKNLWARPVARLLGLPEAGDHIGVRVAFERKNGGEVWTRTFAGRSFSSLQSEGQGSSDKLLCEQFGAFNFAFALVVQDGKVSFVLRRWSIFGIPLPLMLAPFGNCYETVEEGRFCFHVEITHPVTGLIVRYQGWLVPAQDDSAPRK